MTATEFIDPRVTAPPPRPDRQPIDTLRRQLESELAAAVDKPDVTLPVRTRPGWAVVFATKVDADLVSGWVDRATTKKGLDQFQLSLLTLAGHCRALVRNGEPVEFDGEPATFTHPRLQEIYGAIDAATTVRAFYADDALVAATYMALLEACGTGERLDPTSGSPT